MTVAENMGFALKLKGEGKAAIEGGADRIGKASAGEARIK